MQNNRWTLIRTLLRASGSGNMLKYEKDRKKRRKIIGGYIGAVILYAFFAALCILLTFGFSQFGLLPAAPALCAAVVSVIELVFGILRAGSELFARKDYELLIALPFSTRNLAAAKFIVMYIRNLPFPAVFSLSMMVGYGIFAQPAVPVYLIWVILTFFLPMIPTVVASAIGVITAGAGALSKHKTLVQTVLTFVFMIIFVFIGQIAGRLFDSGEKTAATLQTISDISNSAGKAYPPIRWFSNAVLQLDPLSILLLIAVSLVLFELVYFLISRKWRSIHSRLFSIKAEKNWKMKEQKTRSVVRSISFKEYRRFVGSTLYLTNCGFGQLLVLILSVLILFLNPETLIRFVFREAPIRPSFFIGVIPQALFFFLGMSPTTVVSYSLEGKNYWILQSLPITKKEIFLGKMRFCLLSLLPFMLFGCICFGVAFQAGPLNILLYFLCGTILCLFATVFGMYCNIRHVNMDWDKETEVIKQGSSMLFYILPHMFICMAVCGVSVFLGYLLGPEPVLLLVSGAYAAFTLLFYHLVMKNC